MKVVELKQGTPEWVEWRNNGIGASEVGILMGSDERTSPRMLYSKKTGQADPTYVSEAMKYGKNQELWARDWLEEFFECSFSPLCVESEEHSFMRASLDGINLDKNLLVEIKSPYNKDMLEKMILGDIPLIYIDQIQWQMFLTNMDSGFLCIWDGDKCHMHEIEADESLHQKMKEKVGSFWKNLIRGIEPVATHLDYEDISLDNMEMLDKVNSYKEALEKKAYLDKLLKELKPDIETLGDNKNFIIHGVKFTRCTGNSSYDKNKLKEDGVDLDRYKKFGNPYYRSTLIK